jgi:hypothetical protein
MHIALKQGMENLPDPLWLPIEDRRDTGTENADCYFSRAGFMPKISLHEHIDLMLLCPSS